MAECLAGDHALGSLANLNLADHRIRDETLPVLYETLFMDNIHNLPYYKDRVDLPNVEAFRYTK